MPRGQPLNTMNPFSNNKPRLTASERIRNKRDAAIYQGEKQRFQRGKNKCRNRNVKFYKMVKSLVDIRKYCFLIMMFLMSIAIFPLENNQKLSKYL